LTLAPQLPAAWESLDLKRYRVGNEQISIALRKTGGSYQAILEKLTDTPYEVRFAPAFGAFTRIQSVTVDGRPAPFKLEESSQAIRLAVNVRLQKRLEIEIKYAAGIEIDLPLAEIEIGQRTSGLKFLGVERGRENLALLLEGVNGRSYRFRIQSAARELKIDGAKLLSTAGQWRELEVSFPNSEAGSYGKMRITLALIN
jgi:hypothetical protein